MDSDDKRSAMLENQRRFRLLAALLLIGLTAAACGGNADTPAIVLQSGETLRGFDLHFVNQKTDWRLSADPVRIRVSDTETRDIAREDLRRIDVVAIEHDENGFVYRLQVVYATVDEDISGWSFPLGVFALQVHLSPARHLSASELESSFVSETGFHVNEAVREIDGRQHLRIPLAQIRSITFPDGAIGDGAGAIR